MKIMTWNVDWFRNGKHSGKHDGAYLETDIQDDVKQQIEKKVQDFLQKDDSIVFLQEIPDFRKCSMITGEGFKPICNMKDANMHTVAISKDKWKDKTSDFFNKSRDYTNRIIVVEKNDVILVGVHIPDLHRQEKNSDKEDVTKLWNRLIDFCEKHNPVAICGDFNTYSKYDKDGKEIEQFGKLQELMKLGYCEPDGEAKSRPTFKELTHIDYILVRNDLKDRVKSYKVFEKGHGLSDHELLIIDIDI